MKLSTRLSLFFLGTVAIILAGFSLVLHGLASKYLYRQADERLEAALNTLAAAAEVNEEGVEWEPHERRVSFGRRTLEGPFLWAIGDASGRRIDGAAAESESSLSLQSLLAASTRPASILDRDGSPWRIMSRRIAPHPRPEKPSAPPLKPVEANESPKHQSLVIGVGVSLSGVRETVKNLDLMLAGLSLGTWSLALVVGGGLSRRALRPVSEMAEVAHSIGGDEISRRLPMPQTGDELEDLGRAFNGLLDRLLVSNERQRRFAGDASHQLRTPLTAMQGQVDLALRQVRSAEEYQRVLSLVQRRTKHLRQIVEALLFLSRADAESQRPMLVSIDLGSWLRTHLEARLDGLRSSDISLGIDPGAPLFVRVQPALLGELVDNLIDNATKYSEPGTEIRVDLERDSGEVVLSVTDRGIGIAEPDLPSLFEPFFRTETARHRGGAGLGLGLSVALRLAQVFGGTIAVESRVGQGSTFRVRLPEAPQPISHSETPPLLSTQP